MGSDKEFIVRGRPSVCTVNRRDSRRETFVEIGVIVEKLLQKMSVLSPRKNAGQSVVDKVVALGP
jgi:hypothetical protein